MYAVENVLRLSHTSANKIQSAVKAYKETRLLAYLCPLPSFYEMVFSVDRSMAIRRKTGQETDTEFKEYIERSWKYIAWGTDCDILEFGNSRSPDYEPDATQTEERKLFSVELQFLTSGAPPIAAYRRAHVRHGFVVDAYYVDAEVGYEGEFTCDYDGESQYRFPMESDDDANNFAGPILCDTVSENSNTSLGSPEQNAPEISMLQD